MITLLKRDSNRFFVQDHRESAVHELNLDETIEFLRECGISYGDIETALTDMVRNGHFKAEFGNFGSYLYSHSGTTAAELVQ